MRSPSRSAAHAAQQGGPTHLVEHHVDGGARLRADRGGHRGAAAAAAAAAAARCQQQGAAEAGTNAAPGRGTAWAGARRGPGTARPGASRRRSPGGWSPPPCGRRVEGLGARGKVGEARWQPGAALAPAAPGPGPGPGPPALGRTHVRPLPARVQSASITFCAWKASRPVGWGGVQGRGRVGRRQPILGRLPVRVCAGPGPGPASPLVGSSSAMRLGLDSSSTPMLQLAGGREGGGGGGGEAGGARLLTR